MGVMPALGLLWGCSGYTQAESWADLEGQGMGQGCRTQLSPVTTALVAAVGATMSTPLSSQASRAQNHRDSCGNQERPHQAEFPQSAISCARGGSAGCDRRHGPAAPAWSCKDTASARGCGHPGGLHCPRRVPLGVGLSRTHVRQCSSRTPTSSPTRSSPRGCVLCRQTARSSWFCVWKTTSCARQLVTLSPVTCKGHQGVLQCGDTETPPSQGVLLCQCGQLYSVDMGMMEESSCWRGATRPRGMDIETTKGSSHWTGAARPNCMTMGSTKGSSCWTGAARSCQVVMGSMEGSSCWVTSSPWQVTPSATWVWGH